MSYMKYNINDLEEKVPGISIKLKGLTLTAT